MNRAQATDLIDRLFDSWYAVLLRQAYRLTGSFELAEDMVQETFLCLYQELARGKSVFHPKAWCLCVLRRQIGNQLQQRARQQTSSLPDDLEGFAAGCVEPDYARFLYHDVLRFFDRLSEREEQVLLLRMDSLTYSEIAEQLGITTNSVATLLARALRKLQAAVIPKSSLEANWLEREAIEVAHSLR